MSDHNNNLGRFFEDYAVGDIIKHATPRTLTEADASLYISIYPTRFALQSSANAGLAWVPPFIPTINCAFSKPLKLNALTKDIMWPP